MATKPQPAHLERCDWRKRKLLHAGRQWRTQKIFMGGVKVPKFFFALKSKVW